MFHLKRKWEQNGACSRAHLRHVPDREAPIVQHERCRATRARGKRPNLLPGFQVLRRLPCCVGEVEVKLCGLGAGGGRADVGDGAGDRAAADLQVRVAEARIAQPVFKSAACNIITL